MAASPRHAADGRQPVLGAGRDAASLGAALAAGGPQAASSALAAELLARAQAIHDEDVERCLRHRRARRPPLFKAGDRILTHCNAGALATAGYGTALGVIRAAVARHGRRSTSLSTRPAPTCRARG